MSLVETDWLEKNISSVKIIDCSWHMPQTKRNGLKEYKNQHIPNSIFFDLDANSRKEINLPHMLVSQKDWIQIPDRRHDMADALCFILYFLYEKDRVRRLEEQLAQQKLLVENSIGRRIEHFAYHYPESGNESGSGSGSGNESDTEDYLENVTTTKPDMCNFCGTIDEDNIVEHKSSGSVICMNCGSTLCWRTKIPNKSENGEVLFSPPPEIESFRYNLKGFNHF